MSLFSTSPSALLFAVEQSLRGALAALVRADPQGGHSTDPRDYLLLFSIDKSLPSDVLAEATRLFRDIPIPHVGVLSAPVSGSLLPPNAISDAAAKKDASSSAASPPEVPPFYHSVSLSLLPSTLAQPFYSDIPGVAPVKAGRWASGKPTFDDNESRVEHLDEGNESDWRSIWGKENVAGKLPEGLKDLEPASHLLTLVLASDASPQGLLEGVDARFHQSPLLGSLASNTVFETGGREATMFHRDAPTAEARIFDKGAVGLYLRTPGGQLETNSTRARPAVDIDVPWHNLRSLGSRREITRAKGNIVSTLESANACQHFLRDVAARDRRQSGNDGLPTRDEDLSMEAKARGMTREEQRLLSKGVKKEEDFWAVVWSSAETSSDKKPLLVSRILSGHPSRGTISLDTDLALDTGLESPPSTGRKLYLEFYQALDNRLNHDDTVEPLDIPGSDLGAWRLPRFLFINDQSRSGVDGPHTSSTHDADKEKPAVHALPNLFVLSSESGLFSRDPSSHAEGSTSTSATTGKDILKEIAGHDHDAAAASDATRTLQSRTVTWKANGSKAWVDLRGRSK